MTYPGRVTVANRTPSEARGFTMVFAYVDGGETGEYLIANSLVGTQGEIDEIRAQSQARHDIRLATEAG